MTGCCTGLLPERTLLPILDKACLINLQCNLVRRLFHPRTGHITAETCPSLIPWDASEEMLRNTLVSCTVSSTDQAKAISSLQAGLWDTPLPQCVTGVANPVSGFPCLFSLARIGSSLWWQLTGGVGSPGSFHIGNGNMVPCLLPIPGEGARFGSAPRGAFIHCHCAGQLAGPGKKTNEVLNTRHDKPCSELFSHLKHPKDTPFATPF